MGTIIQLRASASPADNMASIDVPANGHLIGLDWEVLAAASGADFTDTFEVSFGSTSQFATNDARATISSCAVGGDVTTSGATALHANKYVALPDIPVNMGERIYLHGTGTAITITARAHLHFDFDLDRPRTRLR